MMKDDQRTSAVLGRAVRAAREERGWSQEELGRRSGLSRPTIARIERGDDISTATLSKAAKALGLAIRVESDG